MLGNQTTPHLLQANKTNELVAGSAWEESDLGRRRLGRRNLQQSLFQLFPQCELGGCLHTNTSHEKKIEHGCRVVLIYSHENKNSVIITKYLQLNRRMSLHDLL